MAIVLNEKQYWSGRSIWGLAVTALSNRRFRRAVKTLRDAGVTGEAFAALKEALAAIEAAEAASSAPVSASGDGARG